MFDSKHEHDNYMNIISVSHILLKLKKQETLSLKYRFDITKKKLKQGTWSENIVKHIKHVGKCFCLCLLNNRKYGVMAGP